jgi:hypothetical protein
MTCDHRGRDAALLKTVTMDDQKSEALLALETRLETAKVETDREQRLHAATGGPFSLTVLHQILEDVVNAGTSFEARYGYDERASSIVAEAKQMQSSLPTLFEPE